jgi:hypothetical protein
MSGSRAPRAHRAAAAVLVAVGVGFGVPVPMAVTRAWQGGSAAVSPS